MQATAAARGTAKRKLREKVAASAEGQPKRVDPSRMTVKDLAEKWIRVEEKRIESGRRGALPGDRVGRHPRHGRGGRLQGVRRHQGLNSAEPPRRRRTGRLRRVPPAR